MKCTEVCSATTRDSVWKEEAFPLRVSPVSEPRQPKPGALSLRSGEGSYFLDASHRTLLSWLNTYGVNITASTPSAISCHWLQNVFQLAQGRSRPLPHQPSVASVPDLPATPHSTFCLWKWLLCGFGLNGVRRCLISLGYLSLQHLSESPSFWRLSSAPLSVHNLSWLVLVPVGGCLASFRILNRCELCCCQHGSL